MGSIFFDKRYWVFKNSEGRKYFRTRAEAEQFKRGDKAQTLEDMAKQWLSTLCVKASTLQRYRFEVHRILVATDLRFDLDHMVQKLNLLPRNQAVRLLKRLKVILNHNKIPNSIQPPKPQHRRGMALSKEQIEKLVSISYKTHYHPLLLFLLDTGCRLGEALGLQWLDYQKPNIHIRRQWNDRFPQPEGSFLKTSGSNRVLLLSDKLCAILDALMLNKGEHPNLPIFTSPTGDKVHRSNLYQRWWNPLVQKFGVDIRIHDLRHTHATHLLQHLPIHTVAHRLGHSSPATTLKVYSHLLGQCTSFNEYTILPD